METENMDMSNRVMPMAMDLGDWFDSCVGEDMMHYEERDEPNPQGLRIKTQNALDI